MRVLISCEYSGRTREAFRAKGHDVISCDLLPAEDNSPFHIVGDVFDVIAKEGPFDLMIGHAPCTYLTNAGVRWLYREPDIKVPGFDQPVCSIRHAELVNGARFFAQLFSADIAMVAIENPVMHKHARRYIRSFLGREIKQRFCQPWWFGDPFFKATGFTLKNLPPLQKPATALVPPKPGTPEHKQWSAVHLASPGPDRWKERSRTFPGISRAMAEAWG